MRFETRAFVSFAVSAFVVLVSGCAAGPSSLPYPAFINVDELPNVFIAGLPGARSKQLAGDPRTQRSSNRVLLPADWQFTTGASPGRSVEIYVLNGELQLGDFSLMAGGYAYIPPGSSGFQMRSDHGVLLLYFLDDANEQAVIQTPLITNSNLINWELPVFADENNGRFTKLLRQDPGSGAKTWLARIDPGAASKWQQSSQFVEGYLLSGKVMESECVDGETVTAEYLPGGYFYRPPNAIHGGPASGTTKGAVWLLRTSGQETTVTVAACDIVAD
jgi:quercetin dioxygenase-like cupin family protein